MSRADHPTDSADRAAALTDHQHGLLVEAGAGSGKTAILAGRVALLLASGVPPTNIAAITFTELAAAELAVRVTEYVEQLAQGHVPPTLAAAFDSGGPTEVQRANLRSAQAELDRLTCSTIHGFAREVLRPYPVEADLDPGASVMSTAEQKLLFRSCIEGWLRDTLSSPRHPAADTEPPAPCSVELVPELLTSGALGREDLDRLIGLVGQGASSTWSPHGQLAATARATRAVIAEALAVIDATPGIEEVEAERFAQLRDLHDTLAPAAGLATFDDPGAPAELTPDVALDLIRAELKVPLFTKGGLVAALQAKGKWVPAATKAGLSPGDATERYESTKGLLTELREAHGRLRSAAADVLLYELTSALTSVHENYAALKRENALLDFDDLIDKAAALLREHPYVRDELADRYHHVLIDEFQDTDPTQAEIVWRLTGKPNGGDWRRWPTRAGSRFVVGDPKQSIYRFRGADADSYAQLAATFAQDDGARLLGLTTNFRSTDGILRVINEAFPEALSGEGQPGYVPLVAWRRGLTAASVKRLAVELGEDQANVGDVREAEASAVAQLVTDLVAGGSEHYPRPLRPQEIALLAPITAGLDIYERALDAAGLEVTSQAGKGYYRRQEVQDLIALARAIADPADTLAFGALLVGPLVGATDEELLDATGTLSDLAGADRFLNVLTDPASLPEGPVERTVRALAPIALARYATTPYELLQDALAALRVEAVLHERHGGRAERALGNVQQFLAASKAYAALGMKAFADDVGAAWADQESELEGRADSSANAVTLITVHSAKGLQWKVVIPVNAASRPHVPKGPLYDPTSGRPAAKLYGVPSSNYEGARASELDAAATERVRLWYVAATRAEDLLIVPQHSNMDLTGTWAEQFALLPDDLPVITLPPGLREHRPPHAPRTEAQSSKLFLEQQRAIRAGLTHIERRAPSRRDEDGPTGQADGSSEPGARGPDTVTRSQRLLTEHEAASLLATLDDEAEPTAAPPVLQVGAARGILLHKLMEELITGELAATPEATGARSSELAAQLDTGDDPLDGTTVAEMALRAWSLPEVAAHHGKLLAEVEVAGTTATQGGGLTTEPGSEPAGERGSEPRLVYWAGVADAVAVDANDEPQVVIDWKSDRAPLPETLDHYRHQLRAYLRLTGAPEGLLVMADAGTAERVWPLAPAAEP